MLVLVSSLTLGVKSFVGCLLLNHYQYYTNYARSRSTVNQELINFTEQIEAHKKCPFLSNKHLSLQGASTVFTRQKRLSNPEFPRGGLQITGTWTSRGGRIACVESTPVNIVYIYISSGFDQGGGYGDTGGGYINSPGFGSPQQSQEKRVWTIT